MALIKLAPEEEDFLQELREYLRYSLPGYEDHRRRGGLALLDRAFGPEPAPEKCESCGQEIPEP